VSHLRRIWYGPLTLLLSGLLAFGPFARKGEARDPDEQAWAAARQVGTPEAFQDYLDRFPTGRHAAEAFAAIVAAAKGFTLEELGGIGAGPAGTDFGTVTAIY
jgi:hypothetical protein